MYSALALASLFTAAVHGQQIGTLVAEVHPLLTTSKCVKGGTCTNQATSVVLDSNWRWLHTSSGTNCYTGNTWNTAACPDPVTCAANCGLDGAQYGSTYGISTSGNSLTLDFVTGSNVGSRVYLMDGPNHYEEFQLMNQEFTFDVDVSNLPCGLNGALYFSQMPADGGMAANPGNKAGANYGTGYCDSQCPQDLKFINGKANIVGWAPSPNNANTGTGDSGSCCFELDIWEANSQAAAYTPHVCTNQDLYECTGAACGNNPSSGRYNAPCDKDGCDFNSYRMGNTTFFGAGMTVDTTKPFTVVTQFITSDGTATGTLVEIRRLYVQNGVIIQNSKVDIPNMSPVNSITDQYCNQQKTEFGDNNNFELMGGLGAMGTALKGGMVLVMSLWDDYSVDMLWLDSDYPTTASPSTPGVARGPCSTTSGSPPQVESQYGSSKVIFSNIKVGDLGSTYGNGNEPVAPWGGSTGGSTSSSTTAQPQTSSTTSTPISPPPTTTANPPPNSCSVVTVTSMVTTTSTATVTVSSNVAPPTTSAGSGSTGGGGATVPKYGQCGGQGWTGGTVCASGSTCQYSNQWYSQCL